MLHQMSTGVVGNQGVWNAVMPQFPCRQRGSLVAGPRLVDPDVDRDSRIESLVNRCECGPPIDGRQPSGIAMGQDLKRTLLTKAVPKFAQQKQSMLTQERAIFGILISDRKSLPIGHGGPFCRGK